MDQVFLRQLDTAPILREAGPEPGSPTTMRHPTSRMILAVLARIVHGSFVDNPGQVLHSPKRLDFSKTVGMF
jgi:hypothetical protein